MNNITLKVGKTYRTRVGYKVDNIKRVRNTQHGCPFTGVCRGTLYRYTAGGHFFDDGTPDERDIIAEWEEEPTEIDMTVSREYLESKPEYILQEADNVNHPSHYTAGNVECIDALESATKGLMGIEAVCTANAIKYLWRWKHKNGVEDLKKAQWFLNKLIEKL